MRPFLNGFATFQANAVSSLRGDIPLDSDRSHCFSEVANHGVAE